MPHAPEPVTICDQFIHLIAADCKDSRLYEIVVAVEFFDRKLARHHGLFFVAHSHARIIPFSPFAVFHSLLFARKRAQYSKTAGIVQTEVQENLNLGVTV